eukprot:gene2100-2137_t
MLVHLAPGDPASLLVSDDASPADVERLRKLWGLDQPPIIQYLRFLWASLHGEFGTSFRFGEPVISLISQHLPATLELATLSILFAVVIGLPLGVIAGARPNSWIDNVASVTGFFGISMPGFWMAIVLILVISGDLDLLPTAGRSTVGLGGPPITGLLLLDSLLHGDLEAFHDGLLSAGALVMLTLIVLGLTAPYITPYPPNQQNLRAALQAPQWLHGAHVLGTDQLGRDILSRIIYGARISLAIALAVVTVSGVIGISLGAISGYFGRKTDFVIQKCVEVVWAFPPLLLAIAILSFVGQSVGMLILALVSQRWIPYCRVARAQALSLRSREFVAAARTFGANDFVIIFRHIIPNLLQTATIIGTFAMATAILSEASLSFLGLGVPVEIPTWGSMLSDGRAYISTSWWLALFPGLAIFITVLGINLLGDGLRDIMDPRLQRSGGRLKVGLA